MKPALFTAAESGDFEPTRFAQSRWDGDQPNGPAVVGLAARLLEKCCGSADFMPTRLTADLFRAAHGVPTAVAVRVVRDGRRIRSADCAADGVAVGTATLFDRSGAFGSGMTTAVSNPAAQIDFADDPSPL